ncbi:MAG: PDZ domain-containing protein [Acidimicrobiales bacterium]
MFVLLAATVEVSRHWTLNEYAITPGNATRVEPLVHIEGLPTESHHDSIMLTDVYLQQLTAWQFFALHFQRHVQFVPASELLYPGVPSSELGPQGYLEMSDSKQDAEVSAFRTLGWKLKATPIGALVTLVEDKSPAWEAKLKVADRVVSLNGKPVRDSCDLLTDMHPYRPGTKVTLGVDTAHISDQGVITWAGQSNVTLVTARPPSSISAAGCRGLHGSNPSWLGISLEDASSYAFPAKVSIDTNDIGGPSAGLAMTLCIIDQLSRHSLTGGATIAATGTMDQYGNVGDVGGVAEKTVAVQRAGAKYFIVPQVEVATARANARPGLTIIGVTTLHQALQALERIGGATPVPLSAPKPSLKDSTS